MAKNVSISITAKTAQANKNIKNLAVSVGLLDKNLKSLPKSVSAIESLFAASAGIGSRSKSIKTFADSLATITGKATTVGAMATALAKLGTSSSSVERLTASLIKLDAVVSRGNISRSLRSVSSSISGLGAAVKASTISRTSLDNLKTFVSRLTSLEKINGRRFVTLAKGLKTLNTQTKSLGQFSGELAKINSSKLISVENTLKRLNTQLAEVKSNADITFNLRQRGSTAQALTRGFTGLRNVLTTFIGGGILFQAARGLAEISDQALLVRARLNIVTDSAESVSNAMADIVDVSQRTRAPIAEINQLYARLALSQKTIGRSTQELFKFTELLSKSLKASGATARETSAVLLQVAQGLGSGRFQGDELRSFLENNTLGAKLLAEQLGTTTTGLREMAEQGDLLPENVLAAFLDNSREIEDIFEKLPVTIADGFTKITNGFTALAGSINEASKDVDGEGGIFSQLGEGIGSIGDAITSLSDDIPALIEFQERFAAAFEFTPPKLLFEFISSVGDQFGVTAEDVSESAVTIRDSLADLIPEADAQTIRDNLEKQLNQLRDLRKTSLDSLGDKGLAQAANLASSSLERVNSLLEKVQEEILRDRAELELGGLTDEQEQALRKSLATNFRFIDTYKRRIEFIERENELIQEQVAFRKQANAASVGAIFDFTGLSAAAKDVQAISQDITAIFNPAGIADLADLRDEFDKLAGTLLTSREKLDEWKESSLDLVGDALAKGVISLREAEDQRLRIIRRYNEQLDRQKEKVEEVFIVTQPLLALDRKRLEAARALRAEREKAGDDIVNNVSLLPPEEQVRQESERITAILEEAALATDDPEKKRRYLETAVQLEREAAQEVLNIKLDAQEQERIAEEERHERNIERLREIEDIRAGTQVAFLEWMEEASHSINNFGQEAFGAFTSLQDGIADAGAEALVMGGSFSQAIKQVAQTILTDLVSSLIKLGIQQATMALVGQTVTQAAASAASAAWSTPAYLASVATYGGAVAVGSAALTTGLAGSQAATQAASGISGSGASFTGSFGGGVPGLATGAVVTKPTIAEIGEGAGPEAVIPLSNPRAMNMLGGGGGGTKVIVNNNVGADINATARMLGDEEIIEIAVNRSREAVRGDFSNELAQDQGGYADTINQSYQMNRKF